MYTTVVLLLFMSDKSSIFSDTCVTIVFLFFVCFVVVFLFIVVFYINLMTQYCQRSRLNKNIDVVPVIM